MGLPARVQKLAKPLSVAVDHLRSKRQSTNPTEGLAQHKGLAVCPQLPVGEDARKFNPAARYFSLLGDLEPVNTGSLRPWRIRTGLLHSAGSWFGGNSAAEKKGNGDAAEAARVQNAGPAVRPLGLPVGGQSWTDPLLRARGNR